jgi:hypothetical protein
MNRPKASDGFAADIRYELLIISLGNQTNRRYLPSVLELKGAQAGSLMSGCLSIQEERLEVVIDK